MSCDLSLGRLGSRPGRGSGYLSITRSFHTTSPVKGKWDKWLISLSAIGREGSSHSVGERAGSVHVGGGGESAKEEELRARLLWLCCTDIGVKRLVCKKQNSDTRI